MLIVEIYSRKFDRNGNRYHLARVTNKANGKKILIEIVHPSNLRMSLEDLFGSWDNADMHSHVIDHFAVPIREFAALKKNAVDAGRTGRELAQTIHSELSPIVGIVE